MLCASSLWFPQLLVACARVRMPEYVYVCMCEYRIFWWCVHWHVKRRRCELAIAYITLTWHWLTLRFHIYMLLLAVIVGTSSLRYVSLTSISSLPFRTFFVAVAGNVNGLMLWLLLLLLLLLLFMTMMMMMVITISTAVLSLRARFNSCGLILFSLSCTVVLRFGVSNDFSPVGLRKNICKQSGFTYAFILYVCMMFRVLPHHRVLRDRHIWLERDFSWHAAFNSVCVKCMFVCSYVCFFIAFFGRLHVLVRM